MREKLLVKQAKRGNKEALLSLISLKEDEYYRLAMSYMKNEEDAMDSLQDMIVKIYENIDKLRDESKFYSWSKTILVNICRDSLREKKKTISLDQEEIEGEEDIRTDLEVEEILGLVSKEQAEAIRLKYILDYSYEEISEILELPIGTVRSRLHYGMKKLREDYRGETNGETI